VNVSVQRTRSVTLPVYSPSIIVSWVVLPRMKMRGTFRPKTSAEERGASARRRSVRSARMSAGSSGHALRNDRAADAGRGQADRRASKAHPPQGAAHLTDRGDTAWAPCTEKHGAAPGRAPRNRAHQGRRDPEPPAAAPGGEGEP